MQKMSPSGTIISMIAILLLIASAVPAFLIFAAAQDGTPPNVSITSGVDADMTYELRVDASDDESGVATVSYYLDEGLQGEVTAQGDDVYSETVDTSGLSNGEYTIYVRVRDNEGNWNNDSSIAISVKHTRPSALILEDFKTDTGITEGVKTGSTSIFTFTIRNTGDTPVDAGDLVYSIYVDDTDVNKPTHKVCEDLTYPDEIPGNGTAVLIYEWKVDLLIGPKMVGIKLVYNDGESVYSRFTTTGIYIHDAEEKTANSPAPGAWAVIGAFAAAACFSRFGRNKR